MLADDSESLTIKEYLCYKVTCAILVALTILDLLYYAEVIVHTPITCYLTSFILKKSSGTNTLLVVKVPIVKSPIDF